MNKKHLFTKSIVAVAITLASQQALAAGFQINEHSAAGLGRAFAGEGAIADNAAVAARNPAAMAMFDSAAFSIGLSHIDPQVDAKVTSGSSAVLNMTDFAGGVVNPIGAAGTETGEIDEVAPSEWVPNIHYIQPLGDSFALGFSAFSNFGLSTDYGSDIAGPIAGDTRLVTANFNINASYRINDNFSIGTGVNAVFAEAELNRFGAQMDCTTSQPADMVTQGNCAAQNANLGTSYTSAHMSGDGIDYGWNIGVLWELNDEHRFGLTYRSAVDITLEGDFKGLNSANQTVDGELELNLPDIAEFSGYHELTPKWAVHYSVMYIGWSSFEALKGTGESCSGGVCFEKEENWKDSYRYAIGTTYNLSKAMTLRAGIARDESPVSAEHRTLSIPDSDRNWYTLGATYAFSKNASVDAGFAYLNGETVTGQEAESIYSYEFEAGGDAYIYSAQFNYTF